jgi:hypothetical protein
MFQNLRTPGRGAVEDVAGDPVERLARPFKKIGEPRDNLLQQTEEDMCRAAATRRRPLRPVGKRLERSGAVVADGDQALAGQDERHGT